MTAVATVAVGMVETDALGIPGAQGLAVGVHIEPKLLQRATVVAAQHSTVFALLWRIVAKARRDCVERIAEAGPVRRAVRASCIERAGFTFLASERTLLLDDLLGAHPIEKIIPRVELANMIKA